MFTKSKLFFWTIEILAVTLLIFLLTKITFLFQPIQTLLTLLFVPFIIAGFLYYIFNPLLNIMIKRLKMKRIIAVFVILLLNVGLIVYAVASMIPSIVSQLTGLIKATTHMAPEIQNWVKQLQDSPKFSLLYKQLDVNSMLSNLNISYTDLLNNILSNVTNSIGSIVGIISSIAMVTALVPILLYYMLMDGEKLVPFLRKNVIREDKLGLFDLLEKMNETISKYISGAALDALLVFTFVFIGYLVMGVPYAFLFAFFAGITNLIPYVGPYIGVVPVILTVAFDDPLKAFGVVAYVLILQQLDGNLVYPKIVGNAVKVHPVTVMVLMLVSGSLYGILGMIVAIPAYCLIKEVVKFVTALVISHQEQKKLEQPSNLSDSKK